MEAVFSKNGTVVWDITPYNLIEMYKIWGGKNTALIFGVRGKSRRAEEIFCDVMTCTPNARAVCFL
jgi:hypothetical protein